MVGTGKGLRKCLRLRRMLRISGRRGRLLVRGDGAFLAKCEEWEKSVPSEEELQRF